MKRKIKIFPIHACQHCGGVRKYVETLIDDEFYWSEVDQMYQPNKFTDMFDHTGNNRCAECQRDWTGVVTFSVMYSD